MRTNGFPQLAVLLFGCLLLARLAAAAQPQMPMPTEPGEPAIGGYSPVSYFTEGRP